jgi:hypothetical protein
MVDIGHTSLVGGLWHGGGFKFHFNLLRNVIGQCFVCLFLSTTRRAPWRGAGRLAFSCRGGF